MIATTKRPTPAARREPPQEAPRAIAMHNVHAAVQKSVAMLPRRSLLDVGAGQGAFSLWAAEQGFDVTAADVDPDFFRVPSIRCVRANLGDQWAFADAQFDVVLAVEVMEHVENHYHFRSIYMEHIHPVPISPMELGLRMNGCEIQRLAFSRQRKMSCFLLPLVYPLIWWRTYCRMILSERNEQLRERNRRIMKLLLNPRLLTGRVAVYTCRKIGCAE